MALALGELESREDLELLPHGSVGDANEGLPRYFRTIGTIPLLTFEDEVRLATAIEAGRAASQALESPSLSRLESVGRLRDVVAQGLAARAQLIEANLRLVVSIARKYVNRGLAIDDLIQAGNLGLMRAVEKFDHRLGFRFSTYATWWVRQAVTRAVTDQARTIRVPAHLIEAAQKVSRALPSPASLDLPLGDDGESVLGDFLPDPDDPELDEIADREYLARELRQMIGELTAREREVLAMRYGLGGAAERTFEDIGRALGVTRERVRQIEAAALRKLRQPRCADRLRPFV